MRLLIHSTICKPCTRQPPMSMIVPGPDASLPRLQRGPGIALGVVKQPAVGLGPCCRGGMLLRRGNTRFLRAQPPHGVPPIRETGVTGRPHLNNQEQSQRSSTRLPSADAQCLKSRDGGGAEVHRMYGLSPSFHI